MTIDEYWMRIAIKQANLAIDQNEIPVGAVLIKDDKLISQAHNKSLKKNDPTAHAEIEVLKNAGAKLQNYRLPGTILYVTLEPCAMCLGAMIHARIDKVVFGAYDFKSGVCGSAGDISSEAFFNHSLEITGGILERDCKEILQSFFKKLRD